jgi:hypothetical protein
MEEKVTLQWSYAPPDFFEEPAEIEGERCTFHVDGGIARAGVTGIEEKEYVRIHDELNGLFLGLQLCDDRPYALSHFTVIRTRPDGTADIGLLASDAIKVTAHFDAQVTGADGKIKSDTRQERIEAKRKYAAASAKHLNDPTANAILQSYRAARNEPQVELIRLYEIRDALGKHFGGESEARKILGISKDAWSRLGKLANDEPLNQGRHRGWNVGDLREATEGELTEARSIAKDMICVYLKRL